MSTDNTQNEVPGWLMLVIFLVLAGVLAVVGDFFTFVVGTLILIGIFSAGYNRKHLGNH